MVDQRARLATAYSLHVDSAIAEIVRALREGGVPSIALKGPALARWLYDDGAPRAYGDCDLLVPPDRLTAAAPPLRGLGFELVKDDRVDGHGANAHAQVWRRP